MAVIFPIKAGLFVHASSDIKSIKDMKGRSITSSLTGQEIMRKTVDAMLATSGLSVKDLKPVMEPNVIRGADDSRPAASTSHIRDRRGQVAEVDAAVGTVRFISLDNSPHITRRDEEGDPDRLHRQARARTQSRGRQ